MQSISIFFHYLHLKTTVLWIGWVIWTILLKLISTISSVFKMWLLQIWKSHLWWASCFYWTILCQLLHLLFLLISHSSVDQGKGEIHIRKAGGRLALISEKAHMGRDISTLEINEWSPNLALLIRTTADVLSRQSLSFLSLRVLFQVKGKIAGFAFLKTSLR